VRLFTLASSVMESFRVSQTMSSADAENTSSKVSLAASPQLRLSPGEIVDPTGVGREMLTDVEVPIVIVGFRNPQDVVTCLKAIRTQRGAPKFQVFISENGGSSA
jgi:hypothetical protein